MTALWGNLVFKVLLAQYRTVCEYMSLEVRGQQVGMSAQNSGTRNKYMSPNSAESEGRTNPEPFLGAVLPFFGQEWGYLSELFSSFCFFSFC